MESIALRPVCTGCDTLLRKITPGATRGSAGWAIYFHQPFGSFDTTGEESKFVPAPASLRAGGRGAPPPPMPEVSTFALPLDIFFVASREPAIIMPERARLTGRAELPPLLSFGY